MKLVALIPLILYRVAFSGVAAGRGSNEYGK